MSALPAAPQRAPASSNVPELTVGELSGALKRTIEDRFGFVRVRGEISNYRGPHSSGHAYFCLKDDAARIEAVVWRAAFARMKVKPQDGLEVIASGRVTTFPGKSTYQLVIDTIEPAGVGALMALLDERRRRLAAEGLFDAARKRALPFLPRRVGVVTSPTGAVIHDIVHRLTDRFPRDVLVWPVRVQGETAATEIAAAIAGFDALRSGGAMARPDVLIVARGGGSLEDLWAFNEEIVVRAAAACSIPLIAAVGHETDTTLIDHVADLRAPTPSGAAEKAVPVRAELMIALADVARRHRAAAQRYLIRERSELRAVSRALPSAEALVTQPTQRLDQAVERLALATTAGLDRRHLDLSRHANRLARQAPRVRLAQMRQGLASLEQRLSFAVERATERRRGHNIELARSLLARRSKLALSLVHRRERLLANSTALKRSFNGTHSDLRKRVEFFGQLLQSLGYRQVLARGFALVRDADGQPVRHVHEATRGSAFLDIEFVDGHISVAAAAPAISRRGRPRSGPDQGTLF